MMEDDLDALDRKAADAFPGFIVRKDLVRQFKGQYPVPTYVVEFLLGRYCAATSQAEIEEGLAIVQKQLQSRTVRPGGEELFKAHAQQHGSVKLLDIVTARLDVRHDCYVATLPSLQITDVRIDEQMVKEQQRRIGAAEFRNTHFGYTLADEGVEKFVSTPELHSEASIGADPLAPGQVWVIGPGDAEEAVGLYRIEVTEGPGSGVRILNQPTPVAFKEAVRIAEQNLYARDAQLLPDREPRTHEFSVQLRSFDAATSGGKTGVGVLVALCSALLRKPVQGGLAIIGSLSLGSSLETIFSPVPIVELAVEKGAAKVLIPVTSRRQLVDLSDDMATKVDIQFYSDARDALLKALVE